MEDILSNPVVIGTAAGVLTSVSMLPQLFKIVKEKRAESVSFGMLALLFCGVGIWIWYGVLKNDYPIIITNSFSLLVNIAIMVLSLVYKKKG